MTVFPRDSLEFVFSPQADAIVDLVAQKRWSVPSKVAISAAVVGSFFRRDNNPNQPYTETEILAEAEAAIDAGAAIIHIHIRNEQGWPSANLARYHKVMGPLRAKYGDRIVTDGCTALSTWANTVALVNERTFELSPVNTTAAYVGNTILAFSPAHMRAQAELLQSVGAKPQMAVYNSGDIDTARRFLIEPGVVKPPYFWCVLHGLPSCGGPMHDPLAAAESLVHTIRHIREVDSSSVIQVTMAGRPSSYVVAQAMLLGVHSIRVGMEDTIYRWPHRDDVIQSNAAVVKDMVDLARILGREVATAEDVRQWLQLPAPAKV